MKGCIAAIAEAFGIVHTAWLDSTRGAVARVVREFAPGLTASRGTRRGAAMRAAWEVLVVCP